MKTTRLKKAFGLRLRSIRTSKGLTQQELAELIGKSTEYVSRMERGLYSPSFDVLSSLAKALMVSAKALFDFEEPA